MSHHRDIPLEIIASRIVNLISRVYNDTERDYQLLSELIALYPGFVLENQILRGPTTTKLQNLAVLISCIPHKADDEIAHARMRKRPREDVVVACEPPKKLTRLHRGPKK